MARSLLLVLSYGIVTVLVLWLAVRLLEPRLAFFPMRGEFATPAAAGIPFEAIDLETADGERLRAWWLPHERPRATVVYFHGNGGNLSVWLDVYVGLWRRGYAVFAMDYRGYGLSTGSPTEAGLYRDVEAVVAFLAGRDMPRPLVYWGRSLGTAAAAHAARTRLPDGLVLEAGFPDAQAILRTSPVLRVLSWFASYRFATADMLAEVRVPMLVIHGTADSVIPFELGRQLHARLPPGTPFLAVQGGDHNDPVPRDSVRYWQAVETFTGGLAD